MADDNNMGLGEGLATFFAGALTSTNEQAYASFMRTLERQAEKRAAENKRHSSQKSQLQAMVKLGLVDENDIQEAGGFDLVAGLEEGAYQAVVPGLRDLTTQRKGADVQANQIFAELRGMGVEDDVIMAAQEGRKGEELLNAATELQTSINERQATISARRERVQDSMDTTRTLMREIVEAGGEATPEQAKLLDATIDSTRMLYDDFIENLSDAERARESGFIRELVDLHRWRDTAERLSKQADLRRTFAAEGSESPKFWENYSTLASDESVATAVAGEYRESARRDVEAGIQALMMMDQDPSLRQHYPPEYRALYNEWKGTAPDGSEQGLLFNGLLQGNHTDMLARLAKAGVGAQAAAASAERVRGVQDELTNIGNHVAQLQRAGLELDFNPQDLVRDDGTINQELLAEKLERGVKDNISNMGLAKTLAMFPTLQRTIGEMSPDVWNTISNELNTQLLAEPDPYALLAEAAGIEYDDEIDRTFASIEAFMDAQEEILMSDDQARRLNQLGIREGEMFPLEDWNVRGPVAAFLNVTGIRGAMDMANRAFSTGEEVVRGWRNPSQDYSVMWQGDRKPLGDSIFGIYQRAAAMADQHQDVIAATTQMGFPAPFMATVADDRDAETLELTERVAKWKVNNFGPTVRSFGQFLRNKDIVGALQAGNVQQPGQMERQRVLEPGLSLDDLVELPMEERIPLIIQAYNEQRGPIQDKNLPAAQRTGAHAGHTEILMDIGTVAADLYERAESQGLTYEELKALYPNANLTEELWPIELAYIEFSGQGHIGAKIEGN